MYFELDFFCLKATRRCSTSECSYLFHSRYAAEFTVYSNICPREIATYDADF